MSRRRTGFLSVLMVLAGITVGSAAASGLTITEVAPSASPEWLELANVGTVAIALGRYVIIDTVDADTIRLPNDSLFPKEYAVVCSDSAALALWHPGIRIVRPIDWSALDNSGAVLKIVDESGVAIDCVDYPSSIAASSSYACLDAERPASAQGTWVLCSDPTPGMPDYNHRWQMVAAPSLSLSPHPFTPDGDRHNDSLAIAIELPLDAEASLSILSLDGTRIRDLGPVHASKVFWDGRDDSGRPAVRGPFVVVARILSNGVASTLRGGGVLWR